MNEVLHVTPDKCCKENSYSNGGMKFVGTFAILESEIAVDRRYGLIAKLFNLAIREARKKEVKNPLHLEFLGRSGGKIHFDLLEIDRELMIHKEILAMTTVALDDAGQLKVEDGRFVPPPSGSPKRRPLDRDPKEWYGESVEDPC